MQPSTRHNKCFASVCLCASLLVRDGYGSLDHSCPAIDFLKEGHTHHSSNCKASASKTPSSASLYNRGSDPNYDFMCQKVARSPLSNGICAPGSLLNKSVSQFTVVNICLVVFSKKCKHVYTGQRTSFTMHNIYKYAQTGISWIWNVNVIFWLLKLCGVTSFVDIAECSVISAEVLAKKILIGHGLARAQEK